MRNVRNGWKAEVYSTLPRRVMIPALNAATKRDGGGCNSDTNRHGWNAVADQNRYSGAEVMKPLATPVLGGMVSSLLHVLIVTPVLFYWLQAYRLGLQQAPPEPAARPQLTKRRVLAGAAAIAMIVAAVI